MYEGTHLVDNDAIEGNDARVAQGVESLCLAKHLCIALNAVGSMQLLHCHLHPQPPDDMKLVTTLLLLSEL